MPSVERVVQAMRWNPKIIAYTDLLKVCVHHFRAAEAEGHVARGF